MKDLFVPVVTAEVNVDRNGFEEAKARLVELVDLLEKANSLIRELASSGVRLDIDVHA